MIRPLVIFVALAALAACSADAAAMYNPRLGRFMQREPSGAGPIAPSPTPAFQYRDGMNLYQYVRSKPTRFLDPSGLVSIDWGPRPIDPEVRWNWSIGPEVFRPDKNDHFITGGRTVTDTFVVNCECVPCGPKAPGCSRLSCDIKWRAHIEVNPYALLPVVEVDEFGNMSSHPDWSNFKNYRQALEGIVGHEQQHYRREAEMVEVIAKKLMAQEAKGCVFKGPDNGRQACFDEATKLEKRLQGEFDSFIKAENAHIRYHAIPGAPPALWEDVDPIFPVPDLQLPPLPDAGPPLG